MVLLRTRPNTTHQQPDPKSKKAEPATDDEPVSSSEEENLSDVGLSGDDDDDFPNTPRAPRLAGPTLEKKLAASSPQSVGKSLMTPTGPRQKKVFKSPGSSRKRTSRDRVNDESESKDGDIFQFMRSSSQQSFKRRKPLDYRSKNGRKSDSFGMGPGSSSAVSFQSESPSSSAPRPESGASCSQRRKSSQPVDEEEKENRKEEFKVPIDIDIGSLTARKAGGGNMGFKQPPDLLPPASISSSSLITSSAWDAEIFDSEDDSPLSSAVSCASLDDTLIKDDKLEIEYLCPMCKNPVEPALLITFQAQPRQRIRDQHAFCKSHQRSSAETEWQEKGYPTIDWTTFDTRITAHFDDLEKILVPDSTSYYRNVLDTTLKSGQAKNFRLSLDGDGLETMSCGYYGTRGSSKMLQAITTRFARKLRRLAADDHIVQKAGVVVYSQAVLVPELAVRLVKEDMGVDDESARQILRESIEIGEKLNFAPNDNVPVTEEHEEVGIQN